MLAMSLLMTKSPFEPSAASDYSIGSRRLIGNKTMLSRRFLATMQCMLSTKVKAISCWKVIAVSCGSLRQTAVSEWP